MLAQQGISAPGGGVKHSATGAAASKSASVAGTNRTATRVNNRTTCECDTAREPSQRPRREGRTQGNSSGSRIALDLDMHHQSATAILLSVGVRGVVSDVAVDHPFPRLE